MNRYSILSQIGKAERVCESREGNWKSSVKIDGLSIANARMGPQS